MFFNVPLWIGPGIGVFILHQVFSWPSSSKFSRIAGIFFHFADKKSENQKGYMNLANKLLGFNQTHSINLCTVKIYIK